METVPLGPRRRKTSQAERLGNEVSEWRSVAGWTRARRMGESRVTSVKKGKVGRPCSLEWKICRLVKGTPPQ